MRSKNTTPFSIWLMSFIFCVWNGFLQVRKLQGLSNASHQPRYLCSDFYKARPTQGWFLAYQLDAESPITPRVMLGAALQFFGFCNVVYADTTLIFLRKPGETGGWVGCMVFIQR